MNATCEKLFEQESRAYRLQKLGLTVDGQPFDIGRYPYLAEMLDVQVPHKTVNKGGQIGFTSTFIFDAALRAIDEDLRGILYLFPTQDDIYDFSRARWDPNVNESDYFHEFVIDDSAGFKRIKNTPIYFRAGGAIGASTKQSLSKLKSVPIDHLVMDESDEMQASRKDAAEKRLDGSKEAGFFPQIIRLSTPTIPGYGIDWEYRELSDMRVWEWLCERCNTWTCLETYWPECIAQPIGKEPYFLCSGCREELKRRYGRWTAQKPERSEEHRGYWVSQLCKRSAADILKADADASLKGRPKEFQNQTLARPWAPVEDQLTKVVLDDCLTEIPRAMSSPGPTCAGADPGVHHLHYVIKERIGDRDSRVVSYGRCDWDELAQLTRKFKVQTGLIDIGAETYAVRDFVKAHTEWWGCRYVRKRKDGADWDPVARVVTCGRNETLDASHSKFLEKREQLPWADECYHDMWVPQLCNMARIRREDERTGNVWYEWVILGGTKNDHLKHAHAYATLAEERTGLVKNVAEARRQHGQRRRKPRGFMAA